MERENKLQKWFSKIETWGIIASAILIVVAVCSPIYFYFRYKSYGDYTGLAALGPVGDFIGGTTVAFLTAASVVLLIATNIMQRKELKISQEQNQVSIKQADLAREETRITNETMRRQQFETTFFNMLQLHHQIVEGIKVELFRERNGELNEETCVGREALSGLGDICKRDIAMVSDSEYNYHTPKVYIDSFFEHSTIEQEKLNKAYGYFQKKYGNNTGHYMRNNYRIVKFIVENVADNEEEQKKIKEKTGRDTIIGDKRFYFGILRAQWSDVEFELILINSLYEKNYKFKKLIKQYDVLDIKETDKEILKNEPEGSFILKENMTAFTAYKNMIEND
ncbi:putative phage abortive infection protein [Bacillus toyonensis]|uniref:putative phage abortive infection protein n=1 Tax=Bacillus toyonensis TaxID=155322 RepID=UPI00215646CD|nr:putative phage abortive infection protein [Bacillus toyonensis]MED3536223.1 putative phage abortive infection protein [Bacillus toyonensis]MEE2018266.1 putative phage abortive infection protein [Bacillus toyonensis]